MAGENAVPFIKHSDYKYVLYNDGNTLSDRTRLLLCLNSVIIKKKSEKISDGMISALLEMSKFRDPYTANHQLGVSKLATAIAKKLKLRKRKQREVECTDFGERSFVF